ncbi:zinc finger 862-like [Paramuricea clavata]|uniref:Zinc finger 862-like n=2 Tax=Paramuricea clavata TaxID=317549 RepID=A0A6S7GUM2_PARCT|nr:zinc finger 862-like [Paramuricea clavata]
MPYEVPVAVSRAVMQLNEKQDEIGTEDEFLDSYVVRFVIEENGRAKGEFTKAGDKRKKQHNREYSSVEFDLDDFDRERCLQKVRQIMSKVIPVLVQTLKARFANYDDAIYSKTRWLNPELWCSEREYGIEDITAMAAHFAKPLEHASFNLASALKEWRSFKIYVRSHYPKLPDPKCLWKSVLSIRREEFPNLCKLASLAICISGSNSTVERTFSVLTNILSDKRLSMRHSTLDDSLIVYGNDSLWSVKEKEEIIDRAVQIYLKTNNRRKKVGQPAKRQKLDEEIAGDKPQELAWSLSNVPRRLRREVGKLYS